MNGDATVAGRWSRGRWWIAILLFSAFQVGIIFWLGDPKPVPLRPEALVPTLHLAPGGHGEFLEANDPSLFALPHREGFSGPAWLLERPQQARPFVWSELPRWLDLSLEHLGSAFQEFLQTNRFDSFQSAAAPDPEMLLPERPAPEHTPGRSVLTVAGPLAGRRLLTVLQLPSWTNADLLTNSVVQCLVGPDGRTISPTLLSRSGSRQADLHALADAWSARFEPLGQTDPAQSSNPLGGLMWGYLIFEWQTLPPAVTNGVAKP